MTGRDELIDELRPEIGDPRVLTAIASVDRALFVPKSQRRYAWLNEPLSIGKGQTISQPLVVARMCQLLELSPGDRVLDVGTGSGYHAAVLARLVDRVISIERHRELLEAAKASLAAAGVENVELIQGDGSRGWPREAPYDAINVAAGSPEVPEELLEQLGIGGRMVAPIGDRAQRLIIFRRTGDRISSEAREPVAFVPLVPGKRS